MIVQFRLALILMLLEWIKHLIPVRGVVMPEGSKAEAITALSTFAAAMQHLRSAP